MATGPVQGARTHANPAFQPADDAGASRPGQPQHNPRARAPAGGLAALPPRAEHRAESSNIASSSNALSAAVYAEGAGGEARRPAAAPRRQSNAQQLKNALEGAKANGASAGDQQAGFQALQRYAAQHHRLDNARANANDVVQGATLAALTFGVGRPLGNLAVDEGAPEVAAGSGYGDAGLHAMGSAAGGTVLNMAAQALLPGAGDAIFGRKMTAVPAEALVPQRTDADGVAIPLSPAETALRNEIKARQQAIGNPGSMANTMAGAVAFTGAQVIRLGVEMGLTDGGAAGAAEDGKTPGLGQKLAGMGFSAGVSATGGALLSSAVLAQKHNATISVPNPDGGEPVTLPLFAPTPSHSGVAPPWRGTAAQVAGSAAMRLLNLVAAGVPIQAGIAAAQRLTLPDVGVLATVAGQLTGVASYFPGLGLIGSIEGPRPHGPAQPAAAHPVAPEAAGPGAAAPEAVAPEAVAPGAAGAGDVVVPIEAAGVAAADSGLTAESVPASPGSDPESAAAPSGSELDLR